QEMRTNARPEISNPIESLAEYKTIYLCYPNWCGTFPRIVATFIESHDLSGKTIYPMCTNEGSGMGRSVDELRSLSPKSIIKPGLSIRGTLARNSDDAIEEWLKK
ncbi:MAG TPA: flavodoxin, partial [Candidatus Enteromonas pullicola]|nr:flavodoxin [Candidatus Enteromonas pullicola]